MCGVRQQARVTPRIVRGDQAGVGEFPWVALLVIRKRGIEQPRCGGTLINDR